MRLLRQETKKASLIIVGAGLSGVCCAITAARQGISVLLVQDRPVLGGNASSEVRLWVLGATSHMGNNNRWAREGGVIDELLVENMWRNPEGNPIIFDSLLLEFVIREPTITLLLNTAVHAVTMDEDRIASVEAYCSQNQTEYTLTGPLFVDASGDGIIGYLSGANFRMGAESASEFQEQLAPLEATSDLLGHSLYFYSRDTGRPVRYIAPAFALTDITQIPRFRELRVADFGCRLWWLEYGGNLDTIHQTEEIKWELWRVAYGVWNYIKNSGEFPDAENLALDWVGMIPGKRESRRFLGDVILRQSDIVEQKVFEDAVGFGGWAIDLHPPQGVFSAQPGCTQWHARGVYQIPYRTMFSRNVPNLFLTGRLLSATHIAFGSTRVMATCAHNGQAAGMAAALCSEQSLLPRDLLVTAQLKRLQQRLLRYGQHIPGLRAQDPDDLARQAKLSASSSMQLEELVSSGETVAADCPRALLVALLAGPVPTFTLQLHATEPVSLRAELWRSAREGNTTPDVQLACVEVPIKPGSSQEVELNFACRLALGAHVFLVIHPAAGVSLCLSSIQVPGIMTLSQRMNKAVAKSAVQVPPPNSGIDTFAFWLPQRRPEARNLAVRFTPPLAIYEPENVINGFSRPWCASNAWVPDPDDERPTLRLKWPTVQTLTVVELTFDTDFDHPMESVLMTHPETVMPGCITAYRITDDRGNPLAEITGNHQTRNLIHLNAVPVLGLNIEVLAHGPAAPALFEVRCY